MISNTISFIFFFEIICSFNCTTMLSYDVRHSDEIIHDTVVVDTIFIDTVINWRGNPKVNSVIALYASYMRNNGSNNEVGNEIRIHTKLINNQIDGVCDFYLPTKNLLIAKATYKRGKLHGNVFVFDNDNIVSHHIYKNNRRIGKCDPNGVLLKLKRHHYYYPKKKCFCEDSFNNESKTKQ